MSAAFGKDSRGRVHSVGPISRTQIMLSAPARAKVYELKAKEGNVQQMVEDLGCKVGVLITGFGSLCNIVKDMQSSIPASVASNMASNSRELAVNCHQGKNSSPQSGSHAVTSSPVGNMASPASSAVREMPKCSLLNIEDEVLAVGKLCTGASGRMFHGEVVSENLAKVCFDDILMPYEVTVKANKYACTFREVGIGGVVLHPKRSIKSSDGSSKDMD